jgi:tetratricopeptide (TPR) repeat protein
MIASDQPDQALTLLDDWIRMHGDDAALFEALNTRCWARALANREIDGALADCQRALRRQPANAAYLDSLGLVQVRRGNWAEAIKAYHAAIAHTPKTAWTHYGLGLALAGAGQPAEAEAEFALAAGLQPDLAERATRMGLARPPRAAH